MVMEQSQNLHRRRAAALYIVVGVMLSHLPAVQGDMDRTRLHFLAFLSNPASLSTRGGLVGTRSFFWVDLRVSHPFLTLGVLTEGGVLRVILEYALMQLRLKLGVRWEHLSIPGLRKRLLD